MCMTLKLPYTCLFEFSVSIDCIRRCQAWPAQFRWQWSTSRFMFITLNLEYIVWFTAELVYMRYGSYSLDTSFFAFKCALPSFCIISARGDSCSRLSSRRRSLWSSSKSKQVVFFSYKSALSVTVTSYPEVVSQVLGTTGVHQITSFFTFKLSL